MALHQRTKATCSCGHGERATKKQPHTHLLVVLADVKLDFIAELVKLLGFDLPAHVPENVGLFTRRHAAAQPQALVFSDADVYVKGWELVTSGTALREEISISKNPKTQNPCVLLITKCD